MSQTIARFALECISLWFIALIMYAPILKHDYILNIPIGEELNPKNLIQRSFLEFPNMMRTEISELNYKQFKVKYGGIKNDLVNLAKNSGAIVIDPESSLCNSFSCMAVDSKGNPIYKDSTHLRPSYVRYHAKFIDETLQCCQ